MLEPHQFDYQVVFPDKMFQSCLTLYVLNFLWGNINIYLHFVLFLHTDTMQVVEILPQIKQEPTYST